jgi:hypothetical protein
MRRVAAVRARVCELRESQEIIRHGLADGERDTHADSLFALSARLGAEVEQRRLRNTEFM